MPLDGAFQVPRAISLIRAFLKQKFLAWSGYAKQELAFGRFQHPLLHLAQFDIQDLLQLLPLKGVKANDFIQAVHEFR